MRNLFNSRVLLVIFIIAVIVILSTIRSFFVIVNYGNIGIITRFGATTDRVLNPGIHFKFPHVESVVEYKTQKITYETLNNPEGTGADYVDIPVDTTTQDGQQVNVRYTIRFAIDPNQIKWVANNLGTEADVVEKVVKTESRVYVRNIVREYEAESLYTGDISKVQEEIFNVLKPKFDANGIALDSFGIRQIEFQPEYLAAIEAKQIEKEKVITEQYKADQEEFRKKQAITKAQGEAEAQRLQQQTLSKELIQKLWIEKWNGELPTYYGGDNDMILQLP